MDVRKYEGNFVDVSNGFVHERTLSKLLILLTLFHRFQLRS